MDIIIKRYIEQLTAPNITDWIQAMASLVAVLGAIAAFINLFKKDKQKERQISELSNMVIKIDSQNIIMMEQILKLSELVGKIDTQNKIMTEQLKISISPFFKDLGDHSVGSGGMSLNLKNEGDIAKNIRIEPNINSASDSLQYVIVNNNNSFIDRMSIIQINIQNSPDCSKRFDNCQYSFIIYYEDRLGNLYYQEIIGQDYSFKISAPTLKQQ